MSALVTYRHNVMDINSIDTFLRIRGGFNNDLRDVYFARALGECESFQEMISEADRRMNIGIAEGWLKYLRIKSLPILKEPADVSYYAGLYEQWKQGGYIVFRNIKIKEAFGSVMSSALCQIEKIYVNERKTASTSMIRNFVSKVLYWTDTVTGRCLDSWNERSLIKILAEDVTKEHEYLFYYFLTFIGCDVLLLGNKEDINVSDNLKRLSQKVNVGPYGTTELNDYFQDFTLRSRQMNEQTQIELHTTETKSKVKVIIPEHKRNKMVQKNIINSDSVAKEAGTIQAEKTFEELAQMASSIVMITVHDQDGNVMGTGSGIMIGVDGYILTNHHVISGGKYYSVRIEDDEQIYPTDEIIKYNSNLDMAVIRIHKKLKPLPIYKETKKLVRGQKVVAIGSPLGLFNSVSDGIISGFRNIRDVDMIQFTAPISPGSSGGAVLNMRGEVIGISTAGIDNGQNINLAMGYENILMFAKGFYKT